MSTEPKPETDTDRRVLRDIDERGWHCVAVAELNERPGWAFTIGLHRSFGHAEVIAFGLPEAAGRDLVGRVAHDVAGGATHSAGSSCDTLLSGLACGFRDVARCWYEPFLGYATWYYGGRDFPVIQLLWPDRAGSLPDRPDFDPDLAGLQPLLEHESSRRARVDAILHSLDKL